MLIAIVSTAIGILLFLCLYLGYREGLRLGMQTVKGTIPEPIKSPVKVIQEHKESKEQDKAEKAYSEGLNAILTYNGDLPKGE